MQVRGLDDGVAVADELHAEARRLRDLHQRPRGGRPAGERHVEPDRVPGRFPQDVGHEARVPDRVARRQDRDVGDRAPESPVPVEIEVGERRLEPPSAGVRARPSDQRRTVPVVPPLGVMHQREVGEPATDPAHQLGVTYRVAPRVELHGAEPPRLEPVDRGQVGSLVVEERDRGVRRERTSVGGATERRVERASRNATRQIPQRDVDRRADRGRKRRRPLLRQHRRDVLVIVRVDIEQTREQRPERFERSQVPVAEAVGVVRADPRRAVLIRRPDERRRRVDLVRSSRIAESVDLGRDRPSLEPHDGRHARTLAVAGVLVRVAPRADAARSRCRCRSRRLRVKMRPWTCRRPGCSRGSPGSAPIPPTTRTCVRGSRSSSCSRS